MNSPTMFLHIQRLYAELGKLEIEGLTLDPNKPEEELKLLDAVIDRGPKTSVAALPTPLAGSTHLISEVIEAYCSEQVRIGQWTVKTEKENRAIYRDFLELVGDKPFRSFGFEDARAYKEALLKVPANYRKLPQCRGKSLKEVIEGAYTRTLSTNTVNKNLIRVSSLFAWAVKHGHTDKNYTEGLVLKRKKRPSEERPAFTAREIEKLFNTPQFIDLKFEHPYHYWVPLIGLYSGARLDEICQLEVGDIYETEGIWVLDINSRTGKKLKTAGSARRIPIHSRLIELGLLSFVDQRKREGHTRLFPELKKTAYNCSDGASKWFARYRRKCGVVEPGKTFHSLRHSFVTRLQEIGVPDSVIRALAGHQDHSVTFGRYAKGMPLTSLHTEIVRLEWPTSRVTPYAHVTRKGPEPEQ